MRIDPRQFMRPGYKSVSASKYAPKRIDPIDFMRKKPYSYGDKITPESYLDLAKPPEKRDFLSSEKKEPVKSIFDLGIKPETGKISGSTTPIKKSKLKTGKKQKFPLLPGAKERIMEYTRKMIPVQTLPEKIVSSYERGKESIEMDFNMWDVVAGKKSYEQAKGENKEILKTLPPESIKKTLPEKALVGASEILSPMVQGGWRSVLGGLIGFTGAVVAGKAIPGKEELVTAPTAARLASFAASGQYWYKQGAGSMYSDMREEGINHEIARNVSAIGALPYALIEYSQVDKLIPGFSKGAKIAIRRMAKNTAAKMTKRYGATWATEVGEEGLQEFVQIMSVDMGKWLDDNVENPAIRLSLRIALEQSYKTMKESALPMLVLVGGSGAIEQAFFGEDEKKKEVKPEPKEERKPTKPEEKITPEEKVEEPKVEILDETPDDIAKAEKPNLDDLKKQAEELGRRDFNEGIKRMFAQSSNAREFIEGLEVGQSDNIMKAWYNGWDKENLKETEIEEKPAVKKLITKIEEELLSEEVKAVLKPKVNLSKFNPASDKRVVTPNGEYTNSFWLLKPEYVPTKLKERMDKDLESTKPDSKAIWDSAKEGKLSSVSDEIDGYARGYGKDIHYNLKSESGKSIVVNKNYYDYLKKNIKDFSLKANEQEDGAVVIYSGEEEAGLLMPIQGGGKITKIKPTSEVKKEVDKKKKISYGKKEEVLAKIDGKWLKSMIRYGDDKEGYSVSVMENIQTAGGVPVERVANVKFNNIKKYEERDKKIDRELEGEINKIDDKYKAKAEEIKKSPPKIKKVDETRESLEKLEDENIKGFFSKRKKKEAFARGSGSGGGLGFYRQPSAKKEFLAAKKPESVALFGKGLDEELTKEPITDKTINKTQIISWIEKTFKVPVRGKATHRWKAAGMYYPKKWIIRVKKWGELPVVIHEVAHKIDITDLMKEYGPRWRKGEPGKIRKIQTELADLDYNQGTNGRRTKEGFAEYMRYRMTTNKASKMAPEFHKFFNNFLRTNQELRVNLDGLKSRLDIWYGQGALNRVIQHIDWKGEHTKLSFKKRVKKFHYKFRENWENSFYVPGKITKQIKDITGEKPEPINDPKELYDYFKSKAGAYATTFVYEAAVDPFGNIKGPGLYEILKPIKMKEMKAFVAYAVSKRAINLEERKIESGFEIDDAKFIVETLQNDIYDKAVADVNDWSNTLLDWLVWAGNLDDSSAKLMRELNPVYLPFKRAFLDEAVQAVKTTGGGFLNQGKAIKAIGGSGRPIINPIESMIGQVGEFVNKAVKVRIARSLINLAEDKVGLGEYIVEVPAQKIPVKFNANQIKNYINAQINLATPGEGVMISNNDYDDMLMVFTQNVTYNGKDNIFSLWVDGKQKFYEVHEDLYQALREIDPLQLGPLLKVMSLFARLVRLGATGANASFGLIWNPIRDVLFYPISSRRKGAHPFQAIAGIAKATRPRKGTLHWRFQATGGKLSTMMGYDRGSTAKEYRNMKVDKYFEEHFGKYGKVSKIVRDPVNAIRDLMSIPEVGPRGAELTRNYKMYKEQHPEWSEESAYIKAFNDAQDITINFTRSGRTARKFNEAIPFFNVAIQGPVKMYRLFRARPIATTLKAMLWLSILGIANWWKNRDEEWYKNLDREIKYNHLFFEIGNSVYRIPIPFDFGILFISGPIAALDSMDEKSLEPFRSVINLAVKQAPDFTPAIVSPIWDIWGNKDWLGRPIESKGDLFKYPTERKRIYTSETAAKLSKIFVDKLGIELSPIQIDYLVANYTGGFFNQFKFDIDEKADMPIIGRLFLRTPEKPKRQLNKFFEEYTILSQKKNAGIITMEDNQTLKIYNSFYNLYKMYMIGLEVAIEVNNKEQEKKLWTDIGKLLDVYGFD
ncbi:MAG: LPD38 domain-containing protein [Patescibacteria group bacterium]|nr:LPD38 domain-containing protein [Patescibacteria group bacterium]